MNKVECDSLNCPDCKDGICISEYWNNEEYIAKSFEKCGDFTEPEFDVLDDEQIEF